MNRDYKGLLASFVEIIVFLFAAFGGFLKNIAPPEQSGATFIVGILSFLTLIALLIVSALARSAPGQRYRRRWILAGMLAFAVALPASYLYPQALRLHTWSYPPDKPVKRLRGLDSDFTPLVQDFLKNNEHDRSADRLARNFDLDQIWTPESIEHAASMLTALYAWLVLSLATAVFCLLEANSTGRGAARQQRSRTQENSEGEKENVNNNEKIDDDRAQGGSPEEH